MDKMSKLMQRGAAVTEPIAKQYFDAYDDGITPTKACAIGCLILMASDDGIFFTRLPHEYKVQLSMPIDTNILPVDIQDYNLDYAEGASDASAAPLFSLHDVISAVSDNISRERAIQLCAELGY